MGMLPVGISIMVTSFSAINFMAIPEEVSSHGLYVIFSFPIFFLAAWPISKIWMPYFQRLQCTTVYEFLEQRYSRRVRLLASFLFLLWRLSWMAIALYVSGKILAAFTGYNPLLMIAVCGVTATIYTCLGGMKAVIWTDVLQFCVLLAGIVAAVCFAWRDCPESLGTLLREGGRLRPLRPFDGQFLSLNPSLRMTFWSVTIGTMAAFMTRYGADQVVMQRYFAAKDLKQAQRGLWLNAFASLLALSLLSLLGLAIYLQAVKAGVIAAGAPCPRGLALRQLVALCRKFPPGFSGLLVAGILAATMSSVDSGINSCSAALATDFRCRWDSRLLAMAIGLGITALGLLLLPPLNQSQSLFAIINRLVNGLGSPLLAIVALGMFSRRTTARGVFLGGLLGLLCSLVLTSIINALALHYYAVLNLLVTLGFCLLCSRLVPSTKTIDKER